MNRVYARYQCVQAVIVKVRTNHVSLVDLTIIILAGVIVITFTSSSGGVVLMLVECGALLWMTVCTRLDSDE